MSQRNDGCKAFEADGAIGLHERVKLDNDGKVTQAGLADTDIGTATREAFAAGDVIDVRLRNSGGTHKCVASEALSAGNIVYTEQNGKVQDTAASTAYEWGIAMEDAGADGDVVEVMPNVFGDANS